MPQSRRRRRILPTHRAATGHLDCIPEAVRDTAGQHRTTAAGCLRGVDAPVHAAIVRGLTPRMIDAHTFCGDVT